MVELNKYTGIILAGGNSQRMGKDKSLLPYKSKTLIENSISILASLFPRVIIIAGNKEKYINFEKETYEDIYQGFGPLGGIHAGLTYSKTEYNFFLAADMPFITADLIKEICYYPTNKLISVVSIEEKIEGLAGKYSKKLLPGLDSFLCKATEKKSTTKKNKGNSLFAFIIRSSSCIIELNQLDTAEKNNFFNINNPEDYNIIKNL